MVFFVCEGCNETLKKNQVDKHAAKCRVCHAVTCVDCSVSFYGNSYAEHVTCVSEAEKYEKGLFKPKVKKNPQDEWNSLVEEAVSQAATAPRNVQPYLARVGELQNVPRNEKKFKNFVKNSLRLFNESLISELWSYLDKFKESTKAAVETRVNVEKSSENNHHDSKEAVLSSASAQAPCISDVDQDIKDKKKKSKRKTPETVDAATSEADGQINTNSEESGLPSGSDEKKKKKKKAKTDADAALTDIADAPHVPFVAQPVSEGSGDANGEGPAKKKSKKDKKNRAHDVDSPTLISTGGNSQEESQPTNPRPEGKGKLERANSAPKKVKKPETGSLDEPGAPQIALEIKIDGLGTNTDDGVGGEVKEEESAQGEKKQKKKKDKKSKAPSSSLSL